MLWHTESSRFRISGERGPASGKSSEPVAALDRGPVLVRLLFLPLLLDGLAASSYTRALGSWPLAALLRFTHSQIDILWTYRWDLSLAGVAIIKGLTRGTLVVPTLLVKSQFRMAGKHPTLWTSTQNMRTALWCISY